SECGASAPKWTGQCADCGAWNTLVETVAEPVTPKGGRHRAAAGAEGVVRNLSEVRGESGPRIGTGLEELDRAIGGGLVPGSVLLIGGDPGIGKSTLLIQVLSSLSSGGLRTLYVSAEESAEQVALRAERLGLDRAGLRVLAENSLERVLALAATERPQVMVVDSIQTV